MGIWHVCGTEIIFDIEALELGLESNVPVQS